MKLVIVLAVLCCFTLTVLASPVREQSASNSGSTVAARATERQAPAAPVAAADDDDDDDDDDEDEVLDLGLDDDDEEDDDEEDDDDDDDDDDGDYVERFIEDILGGEDDDDDDDEDSAVPAANPVAALNPIQSNPIVQSSQPVIPPNVANDLNAAVEDAAASNGEIPDYGGEEPAIEEQAASSVVEVTQEGAQSVPAIPFAPVADVAASESNAANDDDDDDDDDDDEAVDLGIPGVDDDDDDDDDDEDEISELTEARRARAMSTTSSNHVPAVYIAKYNRFVDNILGRINKILRTNYNPVTVRLTSLNAKTKSNKKKTSGKGTKNKGKKNSSKKNDARGTEKNASPITNSDSANRNDSLVNNNVDLASQVKIMEIENPADVEATTVNDLLLSTTSKNLETGRATANTNKKTNKRKTSTKKNKTKAANNKRKVRATLYGLSSLQRVGDVSVNMMSDHTTVKTKFSLGPLTLRVERELGRSGKKELRSATATTAEMSGRLNLRVLHGGAATLHSIRVLQPKQVRVDSADDHDRTREFVWKRSSHIAHMVSEKLSSATKSMLRPPPAGA